MKGGAPLREMDVSSELIASRPLFDRARKDRLGFCNEARLRREIEDAGLDAVVASSQGNVIYTSGAYLAIDVLPTFIVTAASGERAAVVNEADAVFLGTYSSITDIRSFRFGPNSERDALALLVALLNELGLARASLGIELGGLSRARLAKLEAAFAGVSWADSEAVFRNARLVKTENEIEVLRGAARATAAAITQAFNDADADETEKLLAARIQSNALLGGADELSHANINAGVHSTLGHTVSLEKQIRPEEVVHVDFGAKYGGYTSDVSRNAVMRAPTSKQRDIYDRLFQIHRTLLDWLRPGLAAKEVYEKGLEEFAKVGLSYPWGTLGHSIGLVMHEGFELSAASETVLEPGMVICVEPSHIEQGDARYDVEDMVLIRENGTEVLSLGEDISGMHVIA